MQSNWIGKSRGLQFAFGTRRRPRRPRPDRGLHHPPRHPDGRLLRRPSRRTIRWPRRWSVTTPRSPPSAPSAASGGTSEEAHREGREARLRHRPDASATRFDPSWELPVWIANFILMDYGTGAIFGCPAHDQRDLEFATQIRPADHRRLPARGGRRRHADRSLRAAEDRDGPLRPRLRRPRIADRRTRRSMPPSPSARRTASATA